MPWLYPCSSDHLPAPRPRNPSIANIVDPIGPHPYIICFWMYHFSPVEGLV